MKLKIDGHEIEMDAATSILEAARFAGILIPTLCHHPSLSPQGSCRLCIVEIERNGRKEFVTSCNYPAQEGLIVCTSSPEIVAIRRMILELLLARCPGEKILQELANEYGITAEPRFNLEDEKCILCGLCHRICEELVGISAINVQNRGILRKVDTPYGQLSEDCIACGACKLVCPTSSISERENIYPLTSDQIREMEDLFLNGLRVEDLGVIAEIFAGKSEIKGQDGGIVTSILLQGIEMARIDAAVVVQKSDIYGAKAVFVDDTAAVMQARKTKYVRVSVIPPLLDALNKGKRKIAVVGTPCQVRSVRKLQKQGYFNEKFPDAEIILLGLFCFESFDYSALRNHAEELFGIDIDVADKTQISRGEFMVSVDDKDYSCSIRELEHDVRAGCGFCDDFVSNLADISIGSVGSPDTFSSVIVRSNRGKKMLEGVQFCKGDINKEEIVKLARFKKRNASKNFAKILAGQSA